MCALLKQRIIYFVRFSMYYASISLEIPADRRMQISRAFVGSDFVASTNLQVFLYARARAFRKLEKLRKYSPTCRRSPESTTDREKYRSVAHYAAFALNCFSPRARRLCRLINKAYIIRPP